MKKKILALLLSATFCFGLVACGETGDPSETPSNTNQASNANADSYVVGVCQLVQHEALDAATKGFSDVLKDELGNKVSIQNQNASNDIATCATICNGFVNDKVDLILANATPALQAAASATTTIPILGTSITEYGVAMDIKDFNGVVGGNVSGTSDLAPLDQQAEMLIELLPDANKVGILYCSAEPNSDYQAKVVKSTLEKAGLTVKNYPFADSNDVAAVTASACAECDALYTPTDNTVASCAEAISNVAEPAGVPIIAGEEGICKKCGIATLSIDYYELGRTTGEMAVKILKGEADISSMPVEYYQNPVKKYNEKLCEKYGITVPSDYVKIDA